MYTYITGSWLQEVMQTTGHVWDIFLKGLEEPYSLCGLV